MESHISATVAARTLSDVLSRVQYRGESFVVERGGEAVCRIVPAGPRKATVADLLRALERAPRPDAEFLETVSALSKKQPKAGRGPWGR
jgi:antitoxin (DNA-binding transcriptional repressor) of toxin-antitoxin stability system